MLLYNIVCIDSTVDLGPSSEKAQETEDMYVNQ